MSQTRPAAPVGARSQLKTSFATFLRIALMEGSPLAAFASDPLRQSKPVDDLDG